MKFLYSRERDLAEAGKLEAILSLEKLSTAHSEERNQSSEFAGLKSGVDQLRKAFHDISNSLAGLFYNDLEFLKNLEFGIDSCLDLNNANVVDVHPFTAAGGFILSKSNEFADFDCLAFCFWYTRVHSSMNI